MIEGRSGQGRGKNNFFEKLVPCTLKNKVGCEDAEYLAHFGRPQSEPNRKGLGELELDLAEIGLLPVVVLYRGLDDTWE